MKEIGFYNGKIGNLMDISCPIMDRAVYFGDGCYDASYVYNKRVFAVDEHLDRFYGNCNRLSIKIQYSRDEMKSIFARMIDEFDSDMGMIYWQVSRGTDIRYHSFPTKSHVKPNLMAYLIPRQLAPKTKTVQVISLEDTRYKHCDIKTLNLLPSVMATQKAKEHGCNEVIFHRDGMVTEMAHSNVSFLIDGTLVYHPFDWKIMPGISIKRLLRQAESLGIPTQAKELSLQEALGADELIATSSGSLCQRIVSCDGLPVGGKAEKLFMQLQNAAYEDFSKDVGKDLESC